MANWALCGRHAGPGNSPAPVFINLDNVLTVERQGDLTTVVMQGGEKVYIDTNAGDSYWRCRSRGTFVACTPSEKSTCSKTQILGFERKGRLRPLFAWVKFSSCRP